MIDWATFEPSGLVNWRPGVCGGNGGLVDLALVSIDGRRTPIWRYAGQDMEWADTFGRPLETHQRPSDAQHEAS